MSSFVGFMNNILYQPYIVPLFLIAVGIYFTIRTKGVQIRMFGEMCRVVTEKPSDDKSISSFGALMVSTASRVGTGNIIGVCTAIILGGPGAIFWMWITAIFGGANAFIESTLAQIYKKKADDGTFYGGPSYYMQNALGARWLGIIFSVLIIFTYAVGYNMLAAFNLQSTFATFSFYHEKTTPMIIGIILAVLFAVIILGGAKKLTNVTGVRTDLDRSTCDERKESRNNVRNDLRKRIRLPGYLRRFHRIMHHVGSQERSLLQRSWYGFCS